MSIFSSIFEILDSARVALLDLQFKMIRSSFFFILDYDLVKSLSIKKISTLNFTEKIHLSFTCYLSPGCQHPTCSASILYQLGLPHSLTTTGLS